MELLQKFIQELFIVLLPVAMESAEDSNFGLEVVLMTLGRFIPLVLGPLQWKSPAHTLADL